MPPSRLAGAAVAAILGLAWTSTPAPAQVEFNTVKPSTTGVPGSEVRVQTFDAEGNLWIAGRWPFWSEGGLAMLPVSEHGHTPIGDGFDTGLWQVWSSVHHPIPSVYIYDIEFTPDGMMWIASDGGLTRFDRFAATPEAMWHTFNVGNAPLLMNGVRSVDSDSEGRLWLVNAQVNSSNGALFRYDPDSNAWTQYTVGQELPWDPPWLRLSSVHVGSDDTVYVTNAVLAGYAERDPATGDWHHNAEGVQFSGGMQDPAGNLWFLGGVSGPGVWKWNGSSFQSWLSLGGTSTMTGLGLDLEGTVYVSTWYGGVFRMVGGDTPSLFVNADAIPRSMVQRPGGDFWINNYGGNGILGTVRHYSPSGALLERINTDNSGLPDYFIDNIQTDRDGNLWFACGEAGLSRMLGSDGHPDHPTRWRNWGNHNDGSEPYPWAGNEPMHSMYHDDEGYIWMGGNGVGRWDSEALQFTDFWNWQNSNLGVDSFVRIIEDGNGDIWIASDYTGIYRLNPETNDWESHLFGQGTSNYVNDMIRDNDGNVWVATDVSLHFFNGTHWFAVGPANGSPVEWPTTLAADPTGGIWIGADNGLIHYEAAEWTVYDMSNSPIPANHVHGLDVREDGLVGMAVAEFGPVTPFPNGVVLFDGENWEVFTYEEHPLPHYQLGDVEFDAEGDIWVSTISEGVTEIVLHDEGPMGDINGDGNVDVADLVSLVLAWGPCSDPFDCPTDLNGDGTTDVADLVILVLNWS
jgi:ligand-binding sensor domain-containing protein